MGKEGFRTNTGETLKKSSKWAAIAGLVISLFDGPLGLALLAGGAGAYLSGSVIEGSKKSG